MKIIASLSNEKNPTVHSCAKNFMWRIQNYLLSFNLVIFFHNFTFFQFRSFKVYDTKVFILFFASYSLRN